MTGLEKARAAKAKRANEARKQIIREEKARARGERCHCKISVNATNEQLIAMGAGCTAGRWVCPVLDAIRRRLGH